MAKARTWLWIILGIFAVIILCFVGLIGAGVYMFKQHVNTTQATSAESIEAFSAVKARFQNQLPLIRADAADRGGVRVEDLPTSPTKPTELHVLVWDNENNRLVRLSLPLWLLKLGHRKMEFSSPDYSLDLKNFNIDVNDLERIGPKLLLDRTDLQGKHVLVWTE
jgi:hypothetical protein